MIVDDDINNTRKIQVPPGTSTYPLATNLGAGTHKIELVKETYVGRNTSFYGFELDTEGQLMPPQNTPTRHLQFYGDSNLAGYSLESEHNEREHALRGTFFGLAGITSRRYDAAYQNISISGARISTIQAVFDQASRWDSTSTLDVSEYNPDAIIINLGANDVGTPKEDIKQAYHSFLDTLRVLRPSTPIVLFNAWGWDYNEPANFTHEVVAERADSNLTALTFPWVFETWHGCEYDHAGMSAVLTSHLNQVLAWKPKPSDVLSGYGVDGDVANGGFEQTAPFGGYGWRYFNAEGIQRHHDPINAKEGSYYVSLTEEATIHQPNPARDGDEVTVHLWMKGQTAQNQAKIKVDFRDQKMWTSPLKSDSLIVKLTTDWKQYTLKAQAPIDDVRPVFHTRLTIGAEGPGSRIDVDAISMTTRTH